MKNGFYLLLVFFLPISMSGQESILTDHESYIDSLFKLADKHSNNETFKEMYDVSKECENHILKFFGPSDGKYAHCLQTQAKALDKLENYEEANKVIDKLLNICLKNTPVDSTVYAMALARKAHILKSTRDFEKSEALFIEAKEILIQLNGKENVNYAQCLKDMGSLYYKMTRYQKAASCMIESNTIFGQLLGTDHPDYIKSLAFLGQVYSKKGEYKKAEPLMIKCESAGKSVLGTNHPMYANYLNNLAVLYTRMGIYEKAWPSFKDLLAIRENTLGKINRLYANCLNNLAFVYQLMGQFEQAEPLYLESKNIKEKVSGKENSSYAKTLNNLTEINISMGNYQKAEAFLNEAKTIKENVLGKEDIGYATILDRQAILYQDIGNYDKAEKFYLEAISIQRKTLGKDHPRYARSLNNLASLLVDLERYEEAEALFITVLDVRKNKLGIAHPDYAMSLNNLASLYSKKNENKKAVISYLEAINIQEKVLGNEHPDYATSLRNLADLYSIIGEHEKAEEYYYEAIMIQEKVLGKTHPSYSSSLKGLARLYFSKKNFDKANPYFSTVNQLNKILLKRASNHLSGLELQKYLFKFEDYTNMNASFIFDGKVVSSAEEWYNINLFYKGFLLSNAMRIEQTATNSSDSIQQLYYQWKGYQRSLSSEYSKPIANRKNVHELEETSNSLEKDLMKALPSLKEAQRQVTWEEIRDQLKIGEAAIEFTHFKYYKPEATDSIYYVALVIRPGCTAPKPVFLFEEKELNNLLKTKGERRADYVNAIYSLNSRGAMVLENNKSKTLYELIGEPLMEELLDVNTIYYAPSGLLHRINLNAIPINDEENLASIYNLILMSCTRQLVTPSTLNVENDEVILYGGIHYDLNTDLVASTSSTRGVGPWSYLKGTEKEVKKLQGILENNDLSPTIFSGNEGSEESFKKLGQSEKSSPRIIHIATHGYFFSDPNSNIKQASVEDEALFKVSEHPMMRSGLILAGGNRAWINEYRTENKEDGILTALEISQMDLSQTELVVLSACETGLGEIQGNEGVYGLQRAFKIAGVKYIIMSLWQVPDKKTSNLMQLFYRKWLEGKMPIRTAFAAAQQEMSEMGFDPYDWAGFVLIE